LWFRLLRGAAFLSPVDKKIIDILRQGVDLLFSPCLYYPNSHEEMLQKSEWGEKTTKFYCHTRDELLFMVLKLTLELIQFSFWIGKVFVCENPACIGEDDCRATEYPCVVRSMGVSARYSMQDRLKYDLFIK